MKKSLKIFFALFAFIFMFGITAPKTTYAERLLTTGDIESSAKSYVVIEEGSGKILYEKDKDKKLPIASITKVQTLNIVFDEIESGKLNMDSKVVISEHSAKQTGSQAFLDEGLTYTVKDLIKTVVISSANDSAVALAEAVSGTEEKFVERMNKKAKDLNLNNTHFENSTGLPVANHYSTAEDIATMFKNLLKNDVYLKFSKIWMDELVHSSGRKTSLVNTNRLIKTMADCDAGKTGYTDEAKHCLVARCKRGGMNVIVALLGADTSKNRFEDVRTLFNLAFLNYETKQVISQNESFGEIAVKRGKNRTVNAVASESFTDVVSKSSPVEYTKHVELFDSLKAPIPAGQKVGEVKILNEKGEEIKKISLVAENGVEKATLKDFFSRIKGSF